ncbi:MAG TPA: universal stress protein [Nitrospirae bacterium]|nr:universal stress protein [Nitrospirota bacterium]
MKILLSTDGSEYSLGAAKFLTNFNFSPDDEINILHVISWVPVTNEWGVFYDNFKEIRDEVVPKILETTADALKGVNAKIRTSFKEDYPDKAIVEASAESGIDIIVMGARGVKGIGSHIIGSVTKLVAINAHKPVLIINPPQEELSGKIKVLFATDGSVYSDEMGKLLSSIPFPDDMEITILNVIARSFEDIPERFVMEINDRIKKIVAGMREKEIKASEDIISRAEKDLNNRFSKIEKLTKFGDPSVLILNTADAVNADIIVVGSSGMRGIKGMFGSVSRYILNHSKCSVLIGKS